MKSAINLLKKLLQPANKTRKWANTNSLVLAIERLRLAVAGRKRTAFRLRKASYKGCGLQPLMSGKSWEQIRELSYEAPESRLNNQPGSCRIGAWTERM